MNTNLLDFSSFSILRVLILSMLVSVIAHGASLTISWDDNAENEQGFILERSEAGATFIELVTLPALPGKSPPRVTYVDTTVKPGTSYSYRVRAFNAAGKSLPSNTASKTTDPDTPPLERPLAPANTKVEKTATP